MIRSALRGGGYGFEKTKIRSIATMGDPRWNIGIFGAAVAGPVFAVQILTHPVLRKRFKPIIFEQLGPPESLDINVHKQGLIHTAGAAVGIFPNGLFPLYELGLRERLDAISSEGVSFCSIWRGDLHGKHRWYNTLLNAGWDAQLKTGPRAVERRRLRDMLLARFVELGGEILWERKVDSIAAVDGGPIHLSFAGREAVKVDLLVGSDGAWSAVRKSVLQQRKPSTADKCWVPAFTGVGGVYGISSGIAAPLNEGQGENPLILLDQGNISALPLEDGKVAWTLHLPESEAPLRTEPLPVSESATSVYERKMVPGVYDSASTAAILRRHENIYHPTFGSWKTVLEASERIIRSPLRQQVWETDEIHYANVTVIGDASRVLPPYSGQGSSMAIEDATVLADALLNHAPPDNYPSDFRAALAAYAKARVPRSKKVATMASWSGAINTGKRWYWRLIRDLGARVPVGDPKK